MELDYEKYRPYVDHFDLTDGKKDALIHTAWLWAQGTIDRAFGDDPVQMALREQGDKRAPESGNMLEFTKAADGTFAELNPTSEREEK